MSTYHSLNRELELYSKKLAEKKQVVVLNKIDIPGTAELADLFQSKLPDVTVHRISASTTKGVNELKALLAEMVNGEDEQ